jgi:hypothetical protein
MAKDRAFTVVGFWADDDQPVVVGVIQGAHEVTGGEGVTEGGPWATSVMAPTPEHAAELAVWDMGGCGDSR